jgi:hypothetical protein
MSYVYQALVMLPTQNQPSFDRITDLLHQVFDRVAPTAQIDIRADLVTIAIDDWEMNISPHNDANTVVEAQTIARSYLAEDDPLSATDLENYGFHLEVNCAPDEDPHMDRFRYYVSVLEALANFPGAIIFNPITKGFIESVKPSNLFSLPTIRFPT